VHKSTPAQLSNSSSFRLGMELVARSNMVSCVV